MYRDTFKIFFSGLFNEGHMSYDVDRDRTDDGEPSLSQMTK